MVVMVDGPTGSGGPVPIPPSPLLAINKEVQLKNNGASASHTAAGSAADPWDDMIVQHQSQHHTTMEYDSSYLLRPSNQRSRTRNFRTLNNGQSRRSHHLWTADPHHAHALLQVTPQLRFISTASTDMQGASHNSKNNFINLLAQECSNDTASEEYSSSLRRDQANRQAATELASLLWVLAHEMSIEEYGKLENDVFGRVFALIHSTDKEQKVAGLAALDALLTVPSADDERKGIKFANTLSNALRSAQGDFEALSLCSQALGNMAAHTTSVDFVESEITRALEWLRMERSDRRLAASLALREFAMNLPTTFHSKTTTSSLSQGGSNEFLDHIYKAIRDPQPIVRACAADALSQCLKILLERQHPSLTDLLYRVHYQLMEGLDQDTTLLKNRQAITAAEASQHGSLLVVSSMLVYAQDFVVPRYEEICKAVLKFAHHSKALIRLEVVRVLPRLAKRDPHVFGRRYLDDSILFLMEAAATPPNPRIGIDLQPIAYVSLGQLVRAMVDTQSGRVIGGLNEPTLKITDDEDGGEIVEMRRSGFIYQKMADIFHLVGQGLTSESSESGVVQAALHCAADLVEALGSLAVAYLPSLINDMFRSDLSTDLILCLQSISQFAPGQRIEIENRILQHVSSTLARVETGYHPMESFLAFKRSLRQDGGESSGLTINEHDAADTVHSLVLALETLASFGNSQGTVSASDGAMIPLLPFLKDVVARYLSHPSAQVRQAAAVTCSTLLIPLSNQAKSLSWSYSSTVVEEVLKQMLQSSVVDPVPEVRLAIVQALDSRYDSYLRQSHHLQQIFLLLQDEAFQTRSAGLRLLGRLASLNPGAILPNLRRFLNNLIVQLQCGDSANSLENSVRLLVILLQSKPLQRLVQPVLPTLVGSLPMERTAPPRLASASLEALGELAQASREALEPWVHEIMSHVLNVMEDKSSSSKLRTSLRTLGQIAGSTGYVIKPYFDYPKLLPQAIDILPASKRAPWSLRREVIRTLGICGALDPDRYKKILARARPEGTGRAGYFEVDYDSTTCAKTSQADHCPTPVSGIDFVVGLEDEEDAPAHRFMYSQYSMLAQPVATTSPPKRLSPMHEDFYPLVAIQSLIGVLRDPALTVHHSMVVQAIMFIFKSMGLSAAHFLPRVVPHLINTARTSSSYHLREFLLTQLAELAAIVREHLRPFLSEIFGLVETFWKSRHLSAIYTLVSTIGLGSPEDFRQFSSTVVRQLLNTFEDARLSGLLVVIDEEKRIRLGLSLKMVRNLRLVLREYFHVIAPSLLKVAACLAEVAHSDTLESPHSVLVEQSISVFRTISSLLASLGPTQYPRRPQMLGYPAAQTVRTTETALVSQIVQALLRILNEKPPRNHAIALSIVECFSICMILVGIVSWQQYDGVIRTAIQRWEEIFEMSIDSDNMPDSCLELYDEALDDVRTNQHSKALFHYSSFDSSSNEFGNDLVDQTANTSLQGLSGTNRQTMNQSKLQRAWDASHNSSRDDWEEWMRRFSIQLLKEAPSAALRATANLAQAYPPLSRELFCAAFSCCWEDLNEVYRANLVHSLKTAFVADLSPEILQALLNLAEFMEHDLSGGLTIEISVLADLALKCRAYAKALHYKEREYEMEGSIDCVEALININGKLDLPEAARGIVTACSPPDIGAVQGYDGIDYHPFAYGEMCYSVMYGTRGSLTLHDTDGANFSGRSELWLTKIGDWSDALALHEERLQLDSSDLEATVGCMRCYSANGDWREVLDLADNYSVLADTNEFTSTSRRKALRMCAKAAWRLGQWGELEAYASQLAGEGENETKPATGSVRDNGRPVVDYESAFYSSVLHIHRKEWSKAAFDIDAARQAMDGQLTALMAESYSRSYPTMVQAQMLSEMEEIIDFRKMESLASSSRFGGSSPHCGDSKSRLRSVWNKRLSGCRSDVDVFDSILAVRSLVLGPDDDVDSVIKLSELARQSKRHKFGERVLLEPLKRLGANLNRQGLGLGLPEQLAVTTNLTTLPDSKLQGFIENVVVGDASRISLMYYQIHEDVTRDLVLNAGGAEKWVQPRSFETCDLTIYSRLTVQYKLYLELLKHMWYRDKKSDTMLRLKYLCDTVEMASRCKHGICDDSLRVKCWLEIADWQVWQSSSREATNISQREQAEVLTSLRRATDFAHCGYKAYHSWALFNFRLAVQTAEELGFSGSSISSKHKNLLIHVVASVRGFVDAICVGTKAWCATVQQDLLNLLTCLFKYGSTSEVAAELREGFGRINIDAWLGVLPQLLARIHIMEPSIRSILFPLLTKLGEKHPQALIYPLSVLLKSPVTERKRSAESLMKSLRNHSCELVDEALMVSGELIRVAIFWLESWHEGLEDASRHYCGNGSIPEMLDILLPLHEEVEREPTTMREVEFVQAIGHDLNVAHGFLKEYISLAGRDGKSMQPSDRERAEGAIDKAWDVYYQVFRRINKQLPQTTKFNLAKCSPALYNARNLELSVPGTYRVDGSYVRIEKFIPTVEILSSKQRPRKIVLRGNDGNEFVYLLKGHEDLRQDERVMQLFGLVNALLARNPQTRKQDFQIQRYPVAPLSHNCGIVGWVPNCDTLHTLIKDYRNTKKILLSLEHREMQNISPDFELLTVMQKVEVFTEALKKTTGNGKDLKDIMWQKSTNSEEWLERRTKFTRSLASMSMVGYILGLGDRHPSNLMLDNLSGRVLHIDFGDCFEVAMNREKYPEKVPFRLTRMLISAMEVSGVEGSYRSTCEKTMSVLRESRDSLVAMLEAFVYDPLISWRYLADPPKTNTESNDTATQAGNRVEDASSNEGSIGVPLTNGAANVLNGVGPISEGLEEEDGAEVLAALPSLPSSETRLIGAAKLKMHSEMQRMAANLGSRIPSIAGEAESEKSSMARSHSRVERSMRQREIHSLLGGEGGVAREDALNKKALKLIRRVEDKLEGTDFPDYQGETLGVPDQVQRLIVQATSVENLCQLFIGWCSFW